MEFVSPFAFVPTDEAEVAVEDIYEEDLEDADTTAAVASASAVAAAPAPVQVLSVAAPSALDQLHDRSETLDALAPPPASSAPAAARPGFFASLFGGRSAETPAPPTQPASAPAPAAKAKAAHLLRERERVKFAQRYEVDSNVVAFKCRQLASGAPIHTGDVVLCPKCRVALSSMSSLARRPEGMLWTCEFCSTETPLDLVPEEVPKQDTVDYIIKPAPAVVADQDEVNIVFAIDISGSMCVSTAVEGRVALRGAQRRGLEESVREHGAGAQYLPSERRGVTYVSRLQAVQAAVDGQIKAMSKEHPNRKVGLIAFNKEITLIGDGSGAPVTLAGDTLTNPELLRSAALDYAGLAQPVKDSHDQLSEKLFGLEESSSTALGPALLAAITIAGRTRGSRVIVCTDGLANVGVGSLEDYDTKDDEAKAAVDGFYDSLAVAAQQAGVLVSVISIIGEECKLERLGRVADVTGGDVARVSPLTLHKDFNSILAKPLLATNVSATMFLHSGLYFRNADANPRENQFTIEIGNANEDSEVFFDFGVRKEFLRRKAQAAAQAPAAAAEPAEASAAAPAPAPADLTELPFQMHIKFTRLDGMECLRVITRKQPVTHSAEKARSGINVAMYAAHVSQNASKMADRGDYESARGWSLGARRMISRHMVAPSSTAQQQEEFDRFDEFMNDMDRSSRATAARVGPHFVGRVQHMQGRSDEEAQSHYHRKKATSKAFSAEKR